MPFYTTIIRLKKVNIGEIEKKLKNTIKKIFTLGLRITLIVCLCVCVCMCVYVDYICVSLCGVVYVIVSMPMCNILLTVFFDFFDFSNILITLSDDCRLKDGMKPVVADKLPSF